MTRADRPYYPIVRIETPETPPGGPEPHAVLTRVTVNGQPWPVHAYRIEAGTGEWQKVTLTFAADVTIEPSTNERAPWLWTYRSQNLLLSSRV